MNHIFIFINYGFNVRHFEIIVPEFEVLELSFLVGLQCLQQNLRFCVFQMNPTLFVES